MTHNNTEGLAGSAALADFVECPECRELDRAEVVAGAERDASKVTDCRVLRARHRAGSRHNGAGGGLDTDAC
ncbi:hypothetical protein ACKI1I_39045 [Streptomyces turgidiscabies]|uniref:hypothetical protein n=1 Tax=Streptomyces TaxID=1883 RepID=UPI0002DD7E99|nr:hypothetical protein [Streptomyces reticuliscabiei]GAQ69005.1 hypothetical protein T45_00725 [Streptomyces turgidiscabies]